MESGLLGTGVEMSGMDTASGSLTNIVGVIAEDKIPTFQKILFRATRGNIVVRFAEIGDPIFDAGEGKEVQKQVFVGFLQGAHTYEKVKRICDVVGAHVYNYDEGGVRADLEQLRISLKEHTEIVNQSESEIRNTLGEVNASYCSWEDLAKQETGIYATLNRFKYTGGGDSGEYVVAGGWVPTSSMAEIRQTLEAACRDSNVGQLGATMEKSEAPHGHSVPPTYYVVNKYTTAFQAIVEAYGVARYREHNPVSADLLAVALADQLSHRVANQSIVCSRA
jgi:V-type H+-transporting ATPase subunit a